MSQAVEQNESPGHHEAPEVTITCNGIAKIFKFRPDELVRTLLAKALHEFQIVNNPHTYGLYDSSGVELRDDATLDAAGVKSGSELLLRPSTVRAG